MKFEESKAFEIHCNYGVLAAEKRKVYTYGAQHCTAVCSDKMGVKLPENDWFRIYDTAMGGIAVESAWGWNYEISEILQGNEKPSFFAIDKDGKGHTVKLKIIEE